LRRSNKVSELILDLGFLLARASGLVVRSTNAALTPEGMRVRQYSVLSLVCDAPGGVSQRELADVLGLDPSQVVALVDELHAEGLVERRVSSADRRAKLVMATADGRRQYRHAAARAARGQQSCLAVLTDDEQETLRDLLRRIVTGGDQR
jgi:DNA-binding MarR family transcriptional regulator